MGSRIPPGLENWLRNRDWRIIQSNKLTGGFAATIYRLQVHTVTGVLDVIYKHLVPERDREIDLYNGVLTHLARYTPKVYARIETGDELGILMEDVGPSLKTRLRGLSQSEQSRLLQSTAEWLAHMHIQLQPCSEACLTARLLSLYPVESSVAWGREAIQALQRLHSLGIGGLNDATIYQVEAMTEQFYPNLSQWMGGIMTVTHGDPHLENVMWRNGDLCLIDWEYTCVTVPQRDLAILLQDVLDEEIHDMVKRVYDGRLQSGGWRVEDAAFDASFQACFFDNTCMMLGWEILKFEQGHLNRSEIDNIVATKLQWLRESFQQLA